MGPIVLCMVTLGVKYRFTGYKQEVVKIWSCICIVKKLIIYKLSPFWTGRISSGSTGAPVEVIWSENIYRWILGESPMNTDKLLCKTYPPRTLLRNQNFIGVHRWFSENKLRSERLLDKHPRGRGYSDFVRTWVSGWSLRMLAEKVPIIRDFS